MANENENETPQYAPHSFSLGKPLDENEKKIMLGRIHGTLKHIFEVMGMCNELRPGDSEEDRIKRVFIFTSKICGFMTDYLEERGAAVVLDKDHVQAILTEMVIPMPALIEGFGTDVLKDM